MSLHIEPFAANNSNIDGLKIIYAKMSTDDRGTVRELYRDSVYFEVLPETVTGWKQINLTRTKKGAVQTIHITPGIQVFVPQGVCNGFQALEDTEYLLMLVILTRFQRRILRHQLLRNFVIF